MTTEVLRHIPSMVIIAPSVVVEKDFGVVAVCGNPVIAERLAVLWQRHGLIDVPETAEGAMG